jgi:hypothetical protein
MTPTRLLVALVLASSVAAGCLSFGGGSDTTTVNQPTVGQQLLDLKKAYDAGTISQEEYERMRQAILRGER